MASDVSQRAREVAAHTADNAKLPSVARQIRLGSADKNWRVQAFAHFEAEIRADATAIERERCALVAEDELCEIFEDSPEIDSVCNMVVREIATAIRKGPTP